MPIEETAVGDQPSTDATPDSYPDNSLPDDSAAEPSETQTAEEATETESEGETQAEAEPEQAAEESESEQEAQPDEFLASLTPEELAYYAKRYPTLYKAYQDPNQPADLRQAFIDRVNQDHAYAELRDSQQEEGEESEEPTPETQPADATEQRKQYYQQIDDIVAKQIDPQAVNEMGSQLLAAMGVDLQSKDPEIQAIVKNAPKVGQVLARGAVDLMSTTLPTLLSSRLEQVMPGITRMYYRSMYGEVWEETRTKPVTGLDGKPTTPYSKLPGYGTPQFQQAVDKAMKEIPGLEEMVYRDKQGNILAPREQAARKYALLARHMSGAQVNPAAIAQAVDTGKKLADKAKITRNAGRALGAGRSTQQIGQQASEEDDPVMADLDRAIAAQNQALNPFARPKR